ncbi:fatty acid desaturase family protein [Tuberibacillus sp. Marseille-P3662]|uniref:fatty acid desaturase family protein n=1 Tax=Tuberibacillus sp. Marseille-P3662 TaxID=1965358 RepID=UPI000A1CA389|nr:acyl-CoA desaturase [Tuberibacillus sp. Marseille-P3662]
MDQLHSFGWYAGRVAPHLPKKAFKPAAGRLWGGLAYLIVSLCGLLAIGLLHLNPWINLVISIVLGSSFAAMGFLGHEILHGAVVRKPWLRNVLGAVAFWPLSTGPRLWRRWHNRGHHVHTQDEKNDPDSWPSMEDFANQPLIRLIYRLPFPIRSLFSFISLAMTFSFHSFRMFLHYIKDFKQENQRAVWMQLILPWTTWIGLMFLIGPVDWLFAYLLPVLIANMIVMGYISTNHRLNPLVSVNDPLANSLSVTVPKWIDVLHFNFSHHTEHHLFPGMNSKYYPMVKQHIKAMWPERYHEMSLLRALKVLWQTPRLYYQQNELVDPHQGHLYGSLGNGLDPTNIHYREENVKGESPESKNESLDSPDQKKKTE